MDAGARERRRYSPQKRRVINRSKDSFYLRPYETNWLGCPINRSGGYWNSPSTHRPTRTQTHTHQLARSRHEHILWLTNYIQVDSRVSCAIRRAYSTIPLFAFNEQFVDLYRNDFHKKMNRTMK